MATKWKTWTPYCWKSHKRDVAKASALETARRQYEQFCATAKKMQRGA